MAQRGQLPYSTGILLPVVVVAAEHLVWQLIIAGLWRISKSEYARPCRLVHALIVLQLMPDRPIMGARRCFSGRNVKRKERRRVLKIASISTTGSRQDQNASFPFFFVLWLSLEVWNQRVPCQVSPSSSFSSGIPRRNAAKPATTRRHQHVGRPRHLGCKKWHSSAAVAQSRGGV
ncbi:hypothetical protein V8C34DRAFT_295426 [Trichoderma compactum]